MDVKPAPNTNVIIQSFAWVLAGLAIAAPLRAQVSYERDIILPDQSPFILSGNGILSSDPAVNPSGITQMLVTIPGVYLLDSTAGDFTAGQPLPSSAKVIGLSVFSTSSSELYIAGGGGALTVVNLYTGMASPRYLMDIQLFPAYNTLAVTPDGANLVLANNNQIYRLTMDDQALTATSTLLVSSTANGGPLGTLGDGTFGPDGLFHVLDQVNGVTNVESYDPTTGQAGNSFTIASGIPINAGLAISPSGHIYIGDGTGGLDEYLLDGTFLGDYTFTGPGGVSTSGRPNVTLDDSGNIYVYTPNTGMHEYFDATGAVPEPASSGLLLFGAVALGMVRKLGRRRVD
jgi:hypothetical protein